MKGVGGIPTHQPLFCLKLLLLQISNTFQQAKNNYFNAQLFDLKHIGNVQFSVCTVVINIIAHSIFCRILNVTLLIEKKKKIVQMKTEKIPKTFGVLKWFIFAFLFENILEFPSVNDYHEHLLLWIYKLYFNLQMSGSLTPSIWGKKVPLQ